VVIKLVILVKERRVVYYLFYLQKNLLLREIILKGLILNIIVLDESFRHRSNGGI